MSSPEYTLTSNIAYIPSPPHHQQHLDLYTPTSPPKSPNGYPLILYIHGGAFRYGDKTSPHLPYRLISQHTAALASINYRLSGDAIFPAAVQDCRAALRYLLAHAGRWSLDKSRVVVMGESAGGYMALMTGLLGPRPVLDPVPFDTLGDCLNEPAFVSGVIDFYGPTEFLSMDDQAPPEARAVHNAADSPESLFLGQQITEVPELVGKASPLRYVTGDARVLVCHGTGDLIVPVGQGRVLVEKMREVGADVEVLEVQGVGHVWEGITEEQSEELDGVVDRWIRRVWKD